jgi:hypothetical protein
MWRRRSVNLRLGPVRFAYPTDDQSDQQFLAAMLKWADNPMMEAQKNDVCDSATPEADIIAHVLQSLWMDDSASSRIVQDSAPSGPSIVTNSRNFHNVELEHPTQQKILMRHVLRRENIVRSPTTDNQGRHEYNVLKIAALYRVSRAHAVVFR